MRLHVLISHGQQDRIVGEIDAHPSGDVLCFRMPSGKPPIHHLPVIAAPAKGERGVLCESLDIAYGVIERFDGDLTDKFPSVMAQNRAAMQSHFCAAGS